MLHESRQEPLVIDCAGKKSGELFFRPELTAEDTIRETKGDLIAAWEEGRPVVLRNINMVESPKSLQLFFQVALGEMKSVTVSSPLKTATHEFKQEDRKPGFGIETTYAVDNSSDALPDSVISRIRPTII
jgi:hypothetical protein